MQYHIKVYQSIKDIDPKEWNLADIPLTVSMNYQYLLMIEQEHSGQIDFFYSIIKNNSNTVGIICHQLINFKGSYVKNFFRTEVKRNFFKSVSLSIFYRLLDKLSWNLMTSGNIYFTGEAGIHFHNSVTKDDQINLINQCFCDIKEVSKKKISAFLLNNVYDDYTPIIHLYRKQYKYATFPVDPDMFMEFKEEWKKFEDYQSSLSSKYRVRLKKVLSESSEVSFKMLTYDEIKIANQQLYKLYMNTAQKVDLNLGYLSKDYFVRMSEIWEDRFRLLGYYKDNQLIGFMSFLLANSDIDVNYMGLDYESNITYKLYNRMLLDLVEVGIQLKSHHMHLGRTATEIKSTIGANAKSMHIYLKSNNYILNKAMHLFEPYFGSPQYQLRSPFKSPN